MIKKSTLIVLACAIVLGGAVYYFQRQSPKQSKTAKDTSKPAFSVQPSDVVSFSISHPGEKNQPTVAFEKAKGAWQIVKPIVTSADQPTADGFVDQLVGSRVTQTEPVTPDRRKVFGLDPPKVAIEFQLRDGQKHQVLIGDNDFSGTDVYGLLDDQPKVVLLPLSLLNTALKSVNDLRDRSVLHLQSDDVASFTLKNPSGQLAVARDSKNSDAWNFTKPEDVPADADAVTLLLSAVSVARMGDIVSETPEHLAGCGLAVPPITFTATKKDGAKETLIVGKKVGDEYYARDLSRPTIFRVNQDLYSKLTDQFIDLRDRSVVHLDASSLDRIQLHNANGAIEISPKENSSGQWVVDAPAAEKGKSASNWKILDPLTSLRAVQIIDHPPAALLAGLKKPAITAVLTKKDGQQVTVRISKPSGDFAYAQSSESPELFKIKKQTVDDLNLKPADLAY
jgi:Domain of unknown function (DUF4340)